MKINVKGPIVDDMTAWIYKYLGMSAACPGDLSLALEQAAGEDIVLEINSNGGLCDMGFEMYKAIKDYPGKTTAHVINAKSAATMIACAADETLMSDGAIFMIHNSQSMAAGDYRDMEMEADALKQYNQAIITVYRKKTGMSEKELQKLMDHDTYMSPEKAISLGFADGYIYDGESKEELQAVAAVDDIISPKKAKELFMMLNADSTDSEKADVKELLKSYKNAVANQKRFDDYTLAVEGTDKDGISYEIFVAENGGDAFLNIDGTVDNEKSEIGGRKMTLNEFLAENPEANEEFEAFCAEKQAEADARVEAAKMETADAAREEGVLAERKRLMELDEIANGVSDEALHNAKYGDGICDAKELAYRTLKDEKMHMTAYMQNAVEDAKEADAVGTADDEDEDGKGEAKAMAEYVNAKKGGNA